LFDSFDIFIVLLSWRRFLAELRAVEESAGTSFLGIVPREKFLAVSI
jgi:hypothetical protein